MPLNITLRKTNAPGNKRFVQGIDQKPTESEYFEQILSASGFGYSSKQFSSAQTETERDLETPGPSYTNRADTMAIRPKKVSNGLPEESPAGVDLRAGYGRDWVKKLAAQKGLAGQSASGSTACCAYSTQMPLCKDSRKLSLLRWPRYCEREQKQGKKYTILVKNRQMEVREILTIDDRYAICGMHASTSSSAENEAELLRQRGNDFFKKRLYNNAIDCYSRALDIHVSSVVLSNRAQAFLNLHKFEKAYIDANESLVVDPNNVKALYRRAMALNKLGLKARARFDLEKCVSKDQQNLEAKKLFESLKNAVDKDVVDVTCFQKSEPIQSKSPLIKKHIQVV